MRAWLQGETAFWPNSGTEESTCSWHLTGVDGAQEEAIVVVSGQQWSLKLPSTEQYSTCLTMPVIQWLIADLEMQYDGKILVRGETWKTEEGGQGELLDL